MNLGGFGNKLFEVSSKKVYTFTNDTNERSLETEEQDVDGRKPSVYIKNLGLINPSFNIELRQAKGLDVDNEFNEWNAILENKEKHMLFLGRNPVSSNKFLLVKISPSNVEYSMNGKRIKMTLGLTFKEYPRDGVKKKTSS